MQIIDSQNVMPYNNRADGNNKNCILKRLIRLVGMILRKRLQNMLGNRIQHKYKIKQSFVLVKLFMKGSLKHYHRIVSVGDCQNVELNVTSRLCKLEASTKPYNF